MKTKGKHISYCHTPIRYAWDLFEEYTSHLSFIKKEIVKRALYSLRKWDLKTAQNVDIFIANSRCVQNRIKRIYQRDSIIIFPPVDTDKFLLSSKKDSYYLTVSRLVPYKKTSMLVEAFNKFPNKKLIVVGEGEELKKIKKIANPKNIEILGYQPDREVIKLMQGAKAFLYGGLEDFGIVMGEALATGTPVIAYGRCGALDIVKHKENGILFFEQTPIAVRNAVLQFETLEFDNNKIRKYALKFSKKEFRKRIKNIIDATI